MSEVTPTGSLSIAIEAMAAMIASCPAWQTWCGLDPESDVYADALARVHLFDGPPASAPEDEGGLSRDELVNARPMAIVRPFIAPDRYGGRAYTWRRIATEQHIDGGRTSITLIDEAVAEYARDNRLAMLQFSNRIGSLCDGLIALSNTDRAGTEVTHPSIEMIELYVGPHRWREAAEETQGRTLMTELLVHWGLQD